jgi:hypothetical protein
MMSPKTLAAVEERVEKETAGGTPHWMGAHVPETDCDEYRPVSRQVRVNAVAPPAKPVSVAPVVQAKLMLTLKATGLVVLMVVKALGALRASQTTCAHEPEVVMAPLD